MMSLVNSRLLYHLSWVKGRPSSTVQPCWYYWPESFFFLRLVFSSLGSMSHYCRLLRITKEMQDEENKTKEIRNVNKRKHQLQATTLLPATYRNTPALPYYWLPTVSALLLHCGLHRITVHRTLSVLCILLQSIMTLLLNSCQAFRSRLFAPFNPVTADACGLI